MLTPEKNLKLKMAHEKNESLLGIFGFCVVGRKKN